MQIVFVLKAALDVPALNDVTSLGIYMLLHLVEVRNRLVVVVVYTAVLKYLLVLSFHILIIF